MRESTIRASIAEVQGNRSDGLTRISTARGGGKKEIDLSGSQKIDRKISEETQRRDLWKRGKIPELFKLLSDPTEMVCSGFAPTVAVFVTLFGIGGASGSDLFLQADGLSRRG